MARNGPRLASSNEPSSKIKYPEFRDRLLQAANSSSKVPVGYGRLTWIRDQLDEKGVSITLETVRKWFSGEGRPIREKCTVLADLLGVDEAWLMLGHNFDLSLREQKSHRVLADAAVNLLAGMIQVHGGHPSFPAEGDERATRDKIDLYSIIKGAHYNFHVVPGTETEKGFVFPVQARRGPDVIVLGIVQIGEGFNFRVFEITDDVISQYGRNRDNRIDVITSLDALKEITTFAERI